MSSKEQGLLTLKLHLYTDVIRKTGWLCSHWKSPLNYLAMSDENFFNTCKWSYWNEEPSLFWEASVMWFIRLVCLSHFSVWYRCDLFCILVYLNILEWYRSSSCISLLCIQLCVLFNSAWHLHRNLNDLAAVKGWHSVLHLWAQSGLPTSTVQVLGCCWVHGSQQHCGKKIVPSTLLSVSLKML